MTVMVFEVSTARGFQFAGAAVSPAAQLLFGEQREPALHQVEPGAAGRGKVQMEARMAQQPALDGRGLVVANYPGSGADPVRRGRRHRWFQGSCETRPRGDGDGTHRSRCRLWRRARRTG